MSMLFHMMIYGWSVVTWSVVTVGQWSLGLTVEGPTWFLEWSLHVARAVLYLMGFVVNGED